MKFLLTSQSSIKFPLTKKILLNVFPESIIDSCNVNSYKIPDQPLDQDIVKAAYERLHYVLSDGIADNYDYIIAIESGINTIAGHEICFCMILNMNTAKLYRGVSYPIPTPHYFVLKMLENNNWTGDIYGSSKTMGSHIKDVFPWIDDKRWMEFLHKINEVCDRDTLKRNLPLIPYSYSFNSEDVESVSNEELNNKYEEMIDQIMEFDYYSREDQISDAVIRAIKNTFNI